MTSLGIFDLIRKKIENKISKLNDKNEDNTIFVSEEVYNRVIQGCYDKIKQETKVQVKECFSSVRESVRAVHDIVNALERVVEDMPSSNCNDLRLALEDCYKYNKNETLRCACFIAKIHSCALEYLINKIK